MCERVREIEREREGYMIDKKEGREGGKKEGKRKEERKKERKERRKEREKEGRKERKRERKKEKKRKERTCLGIGRGLSGITAFTSSKSSLCVLVCHH